MAVGADLDQNATLRLNYEDAKKKADRIAVKLRERLEPWRQFMDLYTSIEQSDKTIQELVGQLDSKPDGGYHETCADIDLLMVGLILSYLLIPLSSVHEDCVRNHSKRYHASSPSLFCRPNEVSGTSRRGGL